MHFTTSRRILAGSIVSLLTLSSVSFADTDWTGGTDTNFSDAANWNNGAPAGQNARINTIAGNIATISANAGQMNEIFVARGGSPGLLNHSAGTASTAGWMDVGTDAGTGTYNLANFAGTGGTLTGLGLGSGSMSVGGRLYVGGTGYNDNGGTGTVNINTSGTLTLAGDLYVGKKGTGVINMDAGTLNRTGGWSVIGMGGVGGNGTLNMSGGTVTGPAENIIGLDAGSTGALNMSGGTYTSNGPMQIGRAGGNGTVTLNGASAILNVVNNELHIGEDGGGTSAMTVSAGKVNADSWFIVSRGTTTGTLTISGAGEVNQGLTNADSRLELTNPGGTGTGRVNLDGGTLNTHGIVTSGDAAATSIFNFNGGTLKPRAANGGFMGGLDRANVRNGGAKIDTNGFDITISQTLLHSNIGGDNATDGGLTKSGNGTLALNSTASYTGATTINGGTLQLNVGSQDGTIAGDAAIIINSGGTLQSANGTTDSTGYYNHTANNGITINEGGTLRVLENGRISMDRTINSVGGTIASTGTTFNSGHSYTMRLEGEAGETNSYNFTSSAGGTASTISATNVGVDNATFNVTDGPGAIDLNVTGNLVDSFGFGGLTKAGNGVMVMAHASNSYTGPTKVTGGTLEISGSINGTAQISVTSGTLLLSGNDAVNNATPLTLGATGPDTSGTVKFADTGISDVSATFGYLTLSFDSTLDFGSAGGGQEFKFAGLTGGHDPITGPNLAILNWDGTPYVEGNSATDRLIFTTGSASDFTSVFDQADVSFNGLAGYHAIDFGGFTGYEIVAVPEPSSTALLGSLALLGLIGYRERRRRMSGKVGRKDAALS